MTKSTAVKALAACMAALNEIKGVASKLAQEATDPHEKMALRFLAFAGTNLVEHGPGFVIGMARAAPMMLRAGMIGKKPQRVAVISNAFFAVEMCALALQGTPSLSLSTQALENCRDNARDLAGLLEKVDA